MGIQQLGYLGFGVRDLGAWERLMVRALGLQALSTKEPDVLYLRMDERHHRLCLRADAEERLLYIGWEVGGAGDMEAIAEKLNKAGVAVRAATPAELAARKVAGMVRFDDPSGYPTELFYAPKVPVDQPFQPSRPMSGFTAGALGLGHILATATDVAETERFYTSLLGFKVTDYAANGGVFMRCNARHHSAAFHPVGSFGQQAERPQIRHFLIEVKDIDDLGSALDACEDQGAELSMTIGRHSNDLMTSFYLKTPGALNIEYGFGGRLVDDASWTIKVYSKGDLWGHRRISEADRKAHLGRLNSRGGRFPWLSEE
jgi:2,3-dihydroxybiphenyl 1,2-dioxygenase